MSGYRERPASSVASINDGEPIVLDVAGGRPRRATQRTVRSQRPAERATAPADPPADPPASRPLAERTPIAKLDAPQTVRSAATFDDAAYRVLPEQRRNFQQDSPSTYQQRIKPLTAPFLPDSTIEKVRAGQEMAIYNFQSLMRQDWYDFLYKVIGLSVREEKYFIRIQAYQSTFGAPNTDEAFAARPPVYVPQQTPLRPEPAAGPPPAVPMAAASATGAPVTAPPVAAAPPRTERFGGAYGVDDTEVSLDTLERFADGLPAPAMGERATLDRAIEFLGPTAVTVETASRASELMARIDALHRDEMFDRAAQDDEAKRIRRDFRRSLFDNASWLNDPLQTTGVVILTPMYVGAKAMALSLLHGACRGTSLAAIPERELVRRRPTRTLPDGRPDDAWEAVRTMFARLVADVLLHRRMKAGMGVRHAHDLRDTAGEINALLREFVYTVGYDARDGYRTFYRIDPRNDERRQLVYERQSELRYTPYESVLGPQYASGQNAPSLAERRNRITLAMLANG